MKHLTLIITIALLIVIGYAFYTAVDTFATTNNTVSICDTVDANGTAAYDGHNVDSLDANSRHCTVNGKQDVVKQDKTNKSNDATVKPTVKIVHSVPVVSHNTNTPATHVTSDKKAHCNNGNGNGAEGCNASDKGNQDETTVKGDKAENHPTH